MLTPTTAQQDMTTAPRTSRAAEVPSPGRILLVATADAEVASLDAATVERMTSGGSNVFVVAPATPPAATPWVVDDDQARLEARGRLHLTLRALRARGIEADGAVGDSSPLAAIGDVVRQNAIDEIVVFSRQQRASRFGRDLAGHTSRRFPLPVTRIAAAPPARRAMRTGTALAH